MGKKRKADGRPFGEPRAHKRDDTSKLKITTYEDVADSEDEFHLNQDKVLLDEEPATKRLRKWKEQDAFLQPSDDEVLDYSDAEEDEDDDELDEAEDDAGDYGEDEDNEEDTAMGKHRKGTGDEDEDMEGWGPSKKDYYDADVIETEQDALDEEKEARRLQQKQLQSMTEADFGFDEDEWFAQDGEADGSGKVVTEVLPQLQITEDMTDQDRLKLLKSRYPEFEHIAKEYLRLQPLHDELASAANAAERLIKSTAAKSGYHNGTLPPTPVAVTKYRACASYLAAMAMYFAILGSTAKDDGSAAVALDPNELHEHGVMESLLRCQRLWAKVESLPVADPLVEITDGEELAVIPEASPASKNKLEEAIARKKKEKRQKKSRAQLAAESAQAEAEERRAAKLLKTEEDLAALSSLTDKSALRKATKAKKTTTERPMLNLLNAEDSDFGEETNLTAYELAEKARKKKSLRFYTSQIAQKINKRDAASKDYGGDVDVPHRERLKDRQARLQAEAEKRGQNQNKGPGVALGEDDGASEDGDAGDRGNTDDERYYDMVSARNKAKKQSKTDLAAAYAIAQKEGGRVIPVESLGPDGKRKITYEIQKNKGLTPHRKKINKNPRVKKKLKYADKQKKLKSMKPVYGGGEGRGGYGGELTGIKKGLVRSTKL